MVVVAHPFNLEVTIESEEQTLPEHVDNTIPEEHNAISRYIECKSGKPFAIRLAISPETQFRGHDIACFIYLDGQGVRGRLFNQQECAQGAGRRCQVMKAARLTEHTEAPFRFSELQIDADKAVDELEKEKTGSLGTIEVKIGQFLAFSQSFAFTPDEPVSDQFTQGPISEKALKGRSISHRASLDTPRACPPLQHVRGSLVGETVSVKFLYRSRAALEAMYILARSETPTSPVDSNQQQPLRDLQSLSADELRARLLQSEQELERLRESKPVVKRERDGDGPSTTLSTKRVKTGPPVMIEIEDDGSTREIPMPASFASAHRTVDID